MEGDCREGNVLNFFFYLLLRSLEFSLYKIFFGYVVVNNFNCKLGKIRKFVFFDIMDIQGVFKLKMKRYDWIK